MELSSIDSIIVVFLKDGVKSGRKKSGKRSTYTYNKNDRRIQSTTAQNSNADGSGTDQLQRQVDTTYNAIDLITQVNRAGSITQYTPDGYGNTDSSIDPNANPETQYQYDPLCIALHVYKMP